jgi:4'-phosphopantetheinyl transferase EntD
MMADRALGTTDPLLQRAIDALALPALLIGHRLISPGDELALLDEERTLMAFPAIDRYRASGAARRVARDLMTPMGCTDLPILRSASGAPIWPAGITGSLAHDDRVAVAAVGLRRELDAVGIDVEAAVPLPPDMLELVARPRERRAIADDPLRGTLLFVAKEAVYKAAYSMDHEFLEFDDIGVDLAGRNATTRAGTTFTLRYCISSHVLVVAWRGDADRRGRETGSAFTLPDAALAGSDASSSFSVPTMTSSCSLPVGGAREATRTAREAGLRPTRARTARARRR